MCSNGMILRSTVSLRAAIGRQFFPHEDPVAQLLSAFGVFALGYLMRPLGGALFGHIGDKFGRRAALTLSVAAMAIPTFLIGLLPGYATLGLWAPAALTLLRMGLAHSLPARPYCRHRWLLSNVSNAVVGRAAANAAQTAEPSRMPPVAPDMASAPIKPRRPSGARSTRKTTELVNSPPIEKPCVMRNRVSAAGAQRPSVA